MKKLVLIFSILSINISFSQIQVNDAGFILQQYIRTKSDRKEFITIHEDIASYIMNGSTRIYLNNTMTNLQVSSDRLDSLLLTLPEFNKFLYKIKYVPEFDKFGVVINEIILIKKRFVASQKNQKKYLIQFEYIKNNSGSYSLIFNYISFPDVYI